MRMLRWMCGVTKKDKSRTEPCERISKRSTSHNEHHRDVARMMLDAPVGLPGKRWIGIQKNRCKDSCKRDMGSVEGAGLHSSSNLNIIDKIYSHSFNGFCIYVKYQLIDSYNNTCSISNCFSCRGPIQ